MSNETIEVKSLSSRMFKIKQNSNINPKNSTTKPCPPPLSLRDISHPRINKDIDSYHTKTSTIESNKSQSKEKHSPSSTCEQKYLTSLANKYNYLKRKLNKNNYIKTQNKSQLIAPIPSVKQITDDKSEENLMDDVLSNAIILRRLEYDEFMHHKNHLKPKRGKKNKKLELIRKPSFDEKKVIRIQKMYKGYASRVVNKNTLRMKIRMCLVETFCLICRKNYFVGLKRVTFARLKALYHDPFIGINNEMDLSDKLQVKLANKYYNNLFHFNDVYKSIE